ncbi:MAG: 2-C-methyl-D-erythritol 4-phosphate cytidylyltransferase [Flavobacteriaceae bacterium]
MSKVSVILTAAGIGRRMQSLLPKQFMLIHGRPVLMYTIEQFYQYDPKMELILTLPQEWLSYWESMMTEHDFHIPHRIIEGGKERYNSIKNALESCSGEIVAVHDGVRPLVSHDTIRACITAAQSSGSAVPIVSISESIRRVENNVSKAVNRADFRVVQTPQCFKREILLKAYEQPFHEGITDDASLVEAAGHEIELVDGNVENIKITTHSDLKYAGLFLK